MSKIKEIYEEIKDSKLLYKMHKNINSSDETLVDNLYHYTDIHALQNILKNKTLWMSKSSYMNDKSDIVYFKNLLSNISKKHIDKITNNTSLKNYINKEVKDVIDIDTSNIFVLSTTYNRDSLTLWSNYSNNSGYNIGFSGESFVELLLVDEKVIAIDNDRDEIAIRNHAWIYDGIVNYNIKDINYIAESYIEKLITVLVENYNNCCKYDSDIDDITSIMADDLSILSMFIKNPLFEHEEEVRFIVCTSLKDIIKYRISNGILIPYIELSFKINTNDTPITELMIGPKNNIDIAKNSLMEYISSLGYDTNYIKINKSEIPYNY